MIHVVYGPNGKIGRAKSYSKALRLRPSSGPFVIIVQERKFSYPHSGYAGMDGVIYQSTMLLYPPNAKCRQVHWRDFVTEHGAML